MNEISKNILELPAHAPQEFRDFIDGNSHDIEIKPSKFRSFITLVAGVLLFGAAYLLIALVNAGYLTASFLLQTILFLTSVVSLILVITAAYLAAKDSFSKYTLSHYQLKIGRLPAPFFRDEETVAYNQIKQVMFGGRVWQFLSNSKVGNVTVLTNDNKVYQLSGLSNWLLVGKCLLLKTSEASGIAARDLVMNKETEQYLINN